MPLERQVVGFLSFFWLSVALFVIRSLRFRELERGLL